MFSNRSFKSSTIRKCQQIPDTSVIFSRQEIDTISVEFSCQNAAGSRNINVFEKLVVREKEKTDWNEDCF